MDVSGGTFLFVDVDGYCAGGVDQRRVVSARAEGYRAREMGWACYSGSRCGAGSIYFCDIATVPLQIDDGIRYTHGALHGLPMHPSPESFGAEIVVCASRLLEAMRALHDAVAEVAGGPIVVVHKGGNEGVWAARAIPGVEIVDLGKCGCPKVDEIGRRDPAAHVGKQCDYHAPVKRKSQKIVHCPRLEVELLAGWVASGYEL